MKTPKPTDPVSSDSTESTRPPKTEGGWTIDAERELAIYSGTPPTTATIRQTQVGYIRDNQGNIIELEVLHLCETPDGDRFVIDASIPYPDESEGETG
jgi:hypothetical protein